MQLLAVLDEPAPRQAARRRRRRPKGEIARLCWSMDVAIAAAFGVSVGEMRATTRRSAPAAFARQTAMYLAHVVLRQSYSAVGKLFCRDRTTAAYACAVVEERRDDPAIDNLLERLEKLCDELACGMPPKSEARS
jgi:Bacterial dnaA protein helix-turn-helix